VSGFTLRRVLLADPLHLRFHFPREEKYQELEHRETAQVEHRQELFQAVAPLEAQSAPLEDLQDPSAEFLRQSALS
jgi:hypothetical protein